jgi:DNA-directed RNA polymerase specialized sigma24 family protein
MEPTVPVTSTLSEKEVAEAIASLSDEGLLRLRKIANRCSHGIIDPDDLLQEAFTSALEGRRICPRDIDVVRFLAEAIRSLASSGFKSLSRSHEVHIIPMHGDDDCPEIDFPSEIPNADQLLISDQEATAIHSAVLSLFNDDEIAQVIVEGDMDEMDASELYELTGLNKKAYASKRRLIRRRIDKAYPEGWKP